MTREGGAGLAHHPAAPRTGTVVIYLEDAPRRTGSGAHLRFFSNVRGWCDAGATVHLVRLVRPSDEPWAADPDLPLASVESFPIDAGPPTRASLLTRAAYRLAIPTAGAVQMYFPAARSIGAALRAMIARYPDALHVIEGELPAAMAMYGRQRWIWSEHESLDDSIAALHSALPEEDRHLRRTALARERRFAAAVQRRILERADGVIYISERSWRRARTEGAMQPQAFLPLSIADEDERWARPAAPATGPLRLLHLGSVSHLPTYSSLRFLLGAVFPLLSAPTRARVRLTVVGRFDPAHPRCAEIQQLALPFPEVAFSGFARSLPEVYASHDAQIVASVEGAGIRTRVVESLARGLPVLATPQAVDGMPGFDAGRNFVLLADAPAAARALERLVADRASLVAVAAEGRALYESHYSRRVVRDLIRTTFAGLLERSVSRS